MLISRFYRYVPLYPVLGLLGAYAHAFSVVPVCNSSIYCTGKILETVQLARIFPDAKSFVDLKIANSQNETLEDFNNMMNETNQNPTREHIISFVNKNFVESNDILVWNPPDFNLEPPILEKITDPKLREFGKNVIAIWAKLGRQVNPDVDRHPDQYSSIYLPNGFIVPGGRFKEIYYWDSYWVIRGLLLSNMIETARGMIENLLHLVDLFGYIPNGSRIYYLGRSQPPLLTAMVANYYSATGDLAWLEKHLPTVEKELRYWLKNKKVTVEKDGQKFLLLRYVADDKLHGPRPESYYEDYAQAQTLPKDENQRENFYRETKSAAESGWDFSSRWYVTRPGIEGKLTDINTTRIIPVDLNSIFAGALEYAGDLRLELKDRRAAQKWYSLAKYWRNSIETVLWDPEHGVWYDYDWQTNEHRKQFYASCVTPLWANAVEPYDAPKFAAKVVEYLLSSGALDYPGGVPTTISYSGEQWDFPNAWPPLQSILINGLDFSGYDEAKKLAKDLATIWIRVNYIGYQTWKKMFEKYDVQQPGHAGGGGEYISQFGFGWTNGVVLELLQRYGAEITLEDSAEPTPDVRQIRK